MRGKSFRRELSQEHHRPWRGNPDPPQPPYRPCGREDGQNIKRKRRK